MNTFLDIYDLLKRNQVDTKATKWIHNEQMDWSRSNEYPNKAKPRISCSDEFYQICKTFRKAQKNFVILVKIW